MTIDLCLQGIFIKCFNFYRRDEIIEVLKNYYVEKFGINLPIFGIPK